MNADTYLTVAVITMTATALSSLIFSYVKIKKGLQKEIHSDMPINDKILTEEKVTDFLKSNGLQPGVKIETVAEKLNIAIDNQDDLEYRGNPCISRRGKNSRRQFGFTPPEEYILSLAFKCGQKIQQIMNEGPQKDAFNGIQCGDESVLRGLEFKICTDSLPIYKRRKLERAMRKAIYTRQYALKNEPQNWEELHKSLSRGKIPHNGDLQGENLQERTAEYIATALLMPADDVYDFVTERNFKKCTNRQQRAILKEFCGKYEVNKTTAVRRISEVYEMKKCQG